MGRLIVEQIVTADGFAAGPRGSLDHLIPPEDARGNGGVDEGHLRMLESVEAILLGRNTYRIFEEYWPTKTVDEEPLADLINALPKHVVTNTLRRAPWGDYSSATVEVGEPRDSVRRLKNRYTGDIILWGSLTLAGALLQAELVDHVRLRIVPVLLGEGETSTVGLRHARDLRLVEIDTFPSGHVTLAYDVL